MIALSVLVLGYVAGLLTTVALVPEIYKTWKLKDAREISYAWLGSLVCGFTLWIIYASIIDSLPLLLSSVASLIIILIELTLTIRYNHRSPARLPTAAT